MWILLENGMKIDYGDECYDSLLDKWYNMNHSDVFGKEYNEEFHVPMRRKIHDVEELFTSYNTTQQAHYKTDAS
jgi:hypothetical protein